MEFKNIDFDTFMNMSFDDFINLQNQDYIKMENDMVSLNNDLFDFILPIPYMDFMDMDFEDFSNVFDNAVNSISNKQENKQEIKQENKQEKISKSICINKNCNKNQFKNNLCMFHYKQIKGNVCNIDGCSNIKHKNNNNECYKHYAPKCTRKKCKRLTFNHKYLCKDHNKAYKNLCKFRTCESYKIKKHNKCEKHLKMK
jgi:hypothetical protein